MSNNVLAPPVAPYRKVSLGINLKGGIYNQSIIVMIICRIKVAILFIFSLNIPQALCLQPIQNAQMYEKYD